MSEELTMKALEDIIKEGKELENQSDITPVGIPDEFVKAIHVTVTPIEKTSATIQLEKAMNEAIFEEPMYNVKSITTVYSDASSATVAILFKRKF